MNAAALPPRLLLNPLSLRASYVWLYRRQGWLWLLAGLTPAVLFVPWLALCGSAGVTGRMGTATGLVLGLLLTLSVVSDLLWRRIFNGVTVPAVLWALALPLLGVGVLSLTEALLGLLACFGVMFFLFCTFHGGAGDVKLLTAVGALLGAGPGLTAMLYGYVFAAVFALGLLVWRAGPLRLLALLLPIPALRFVVAPPAKNVLRARLPMAPFLAAGVIAALMV